MSSSDIYSSKESQLALLLLVHPFDCAVNKIHSKERGKAGGTWKGQEAASS